MKLSVVLFVALACSGAFATLLDFTTPAFGKAPIINPDLPDKQSPCTFDIDARLVSKEDVRAKDVQPFVCNGAVIEYIRMLDEDEFQFKVALRRGHDKGGTIQFRLIDDAGTVVTVGEAFENLDEGSYSYLTGKYKLRNKDFDRVFAKGNNPIFRITLRVQD